MQVGGPWTGHTNEVSSQQLPTKHIATFQHASLICAAFSADNARILSGGYDKKVTVWKALKGSLRADASK
jgi:WD40 repeat protein